MYVFSIIIYLSREHLTQEVRVILWVDDLVFSVGETEF